MKRILSILLLFASLCSSGQMIISPYRYTSSGPQNGDLLAAFNFNETAQSVSGWADVSGNPHTGVRTGTQNGYSVSTIATARWSSFASITSHNTNGEAGGTYFPATVMQSFMFNYSVSWSTSANNNLRISGLTSGQLYSIEISGSWNTAITGSVDASPTAVRVNNGSAQTYNANDNTSTGLIVTGTADASGYIELWVGGVSGTSNAGFIGGLRLYFGSIL